MKKHMIILFLICINISILAQSPITEFEETISYWNCDYVRAEFHYISSSTADRDSVCWDFGDGGTNCNSYTNGASHNYTQPGVYTVKLTIWKDGIETQIIKPDLITVYKAPKVLFTYTVSNSSYFAPLEVNFFNQTIPGDGDKMTFSWKTDYFSEPLSNDSNFSYVFDKSGTYYIQLIVNDNNGCIVGNSDYIIVKDSMQANEFEFLTSDCTYETEPICERGVNYKIENDTLKIFGQVERNCCTHNTAVIIDKIDTIQIPTFETGPTCDCNCTFCFEINIPDFQRDSCVIMFDNQAFNVNRGLNSISQSKYKPAITIIPNPFNESIEIALEKTLNSRYNIQIFDLNGQLLINSSILNNPTIVNMSFLSKGIYILKITENNRTLYKNKLIKN